jgi:hypothetical protein
VFSVFPGNTSRMTDEEENSAFRARQYAEAAVKLSDSGNDQAETYALLAHTHATLAVVDALAEIRDRLPSG